MILVAGGSGGLGRTFVDRDHLGTHFSKKYKNTEFADFSKSENETWKKLDELCRGKDIDCVVSTISYTDVDGSERDFEKSKKITRDSNIQICDWCNKNKLPFIFISSNDIFDGERGLYLENDKPLPVNNYCLHKIEAEEHILKCEGDNLIIRCSLLEDYSSFKKIPLIVKIYNSIIEKIDVSLFRDSYNSPVSIEFVCDFIESFLKSNFKKWNGIRHLHSERVSKYEIGEIMCDILGYNYNNIKESSISDCNFLAKRPKDVSLLSLYDNCNLGSIHKNISNIIYSIGQKDKTLNG